MKVRSPALLLLVTLGCAASWRTVAVYEGWSLHERNRPSLDAGLWASEVEPARQAVVDWLGPFEEAVRVHALEAPVHLSEDGRSVVHAAEASQPVPGMGTATIKGYHTRSTSASDSGVFVQEADSGTLVHELVHARLAELEPDLPLWFEEGVACLLADGLVVEGRWVRDGFSAWPWVELRASRPRPLELERVLARSSNEPMGVRENVLAHLVGWALVFDLWRETRSDSWQDWFEAFDWEHPLVDAQRRLDRVLSPAVPAGWLRARLASPSQPVRLAALRGAWKLASPETGAALLAALELEIDPEVRASLAVNLLASGPALAADAAGLRQAHEEARRALEAVELPRVDEAGAARALCRSLRGGPGDPDVALEGLRRFWDE
jgi:hypothetical protein